MWSDDDFLLEGYDLGFPEERTPLLQAIADGDLEAVRARLAAGDNVDEVGRARDTPLVKALKLGHAEIVRELVAAGADVNLDSSWKTPLGHAFPDLRLMRLLIRAGAEIDKPGEKDYVLTAAVKAADPLAVRLLLEGGADPLAAEEEGVLLYEAIRKKEWEIYYELLPYYPEGYVLEARDDLRCFDPIDPSMIADRASLELTIAAQLGELLKVRNLLEEGEADLDCTKWRGPALKSAASCPHLDVMRALLEAGAGVDVVSDDEISMFGSTPLSSAVYVADAAKLEAAVRMLLEAGATPDLQGHLGRTALMHAVLAAYRKDSGLLGVELLLDAGANVGLRDELGYDAWMLARFPLLEQEETDQAPQKTPRRQDFVRWNRMSEDELRQKADRCRTICGILERAGAVPRGVLDMRLLAATAAGNEARVKQLLEAGADPDARDAEGDPAVILAASKGWSKVVKELVAANCDVDAVNVMRWHNDATALKLAVLDADLDLVRRLLGAGADPLRLPNLPSGDPHSPLAKAERQGPQELVELIRGLLPPPEVDTEEEYDDEPPEMTAEEKRLSVLVETAYDGSLALFREQLAAGDTDLDGVDLYGRTALAAAAEAGRPETMRELIAAGADVNGNNAVEAHPRSTPLICAAISPSADRGRTLRILIEAGADVDLPGADGKTALMHAVERDVGFFGRNGDPALSTRTLIEAGADLEIRDPSGLTAWTRAMSLAWSINDPEIAEAFRGIARRLEEAGASTDAAPELELVRAAGGPLLRFPSFDSGAREDQVDSEDSRRIRELLAAGANPDARRHDGVPALILAVRSRRPGIVRQLIEAGCEVDARKRPARGSTALIEAVRAGSYELVEMLVEAGADPALRGDPPYRRTCARALAAEGRHRRIAEFLGEPIFEVPNRFPGMMLLSG